MLVGRTDALGTDSVQVELGRNRAMAVRAALLSAGLPPESIDVTSVGATDPLPATDADATARINRSVSLEVTVSDSASTPAPRGRTGAQ